MNCLVGPTNRTGLTTTMFLRRWEGVNCQRATECAFRDWPSPGCTVLVSGVRVGFVEGWMSHFGGGVVVEVAGVESWNGVPRPGSLHRGREIGCWRFLGLVVRCWAFSLNRAHKWTPVSPGRGSIETTSSGREIGRMPCSIVVGTCYLLRPELNVPKALQCGPSRCRGRPLRG